MLYQEHTTLWNKIREFPLDEPGAAITFSHKLKEQQKWTAHYTERVIDEYRKFIFLCFVAPKGASPSKAVDEAWHLHLTYTKSYWVDLCRNTLGREIHHHPSKGGEPEDHKHAEWYAETLALYRQVFGSDPPEDIWLPPPAEAYYFPEPTFKPDRRGIIKIAIVLILPFAFSTIFFGAIWPYHLTGHQFLLFFPIFIISIFGVHILIEKQKEDHYARLVREHFGKDTSIFQQAKFIFGKHRALQAAIVDLIRRGLLDVNTDRNFIVKKDNYYHSQNNEQNPLVEFFLQEENGHELNYEMIDIRWYDEQKFSHPVLEKLYRFAYAVKTMREKYMINCIIFFVGLTRLLQGWANGKPTGFLILEIIVLFIVGRMIQKNASRAGTIFSEAKGMFTQKVITKNIYEDDVVAHFAVNGSDSIKWFAEGLVLALIFRKHPAISHTSISYDYGLSAGCSSCSSCGSGGGGGCGGGGCGGCGGGD